MAKPILLTVDDDAEVLRAVERDLRRKYGSEYRVIRADSGRAALEALEQLKTRGDAVAMLIADQRMPGMTGVEFLEQARTIFPDAKRVLLTAYADTDAAIRAINRSDFTTTYEAVGSARGNLYPTSAICSPTERLYRPVSTASRSSDCAVPGSRTSCATSSAETSFRSSGWTSTPTKEARTLLAAATNGDDSPSCRSWCIPTGRTTPTQRRGSSRSASAFAHSRKRSTT